MKITKSQLKQIIKEEMEGRLDEVYWGPADPDHPEHQEFLKYQSQQPQPAAGLVKPPSLDDRVARLEEKLDELKANAHLIAAAPELYEALERVVRISDRDHVAWNEAKAALAKARGET